MKPSVLIIADFPNWAYYAIQQFIKNNISDEFDVYCDYLKFNTIKKSKNPKNWIKTYMEKKRFQHVKKDGIYDIVVFLGFYFPEHMKLNFKAKYVVKGIYTDGFPPSNSNFEGDINEFVAKFFSNTDAVVCGSPLIQVFYSEIVKSAYFANSVLNNSLFKRKVEKKINTSQIFTVGWTGNPKREFKGLYTHIKPAVALAKQKYPSIELKLRFTGPIETLPLFYNDVDVIIIASDADAGPFLFGEASLMDVPSISTDIGWPHEVIKSGENGFIVDKSIEAISKRVIQLYEDRELLFLMSKRIRGDYLAVFNTQIMVKRWKTMFHELLNKNNAN